MASILIIGHSFYTLQPAVDVQLLVAGCEAITDDNLHKFIESLKVLICAWLKRITKL